MLYAGEGGGRRGGGDREDWEECNLCVAVHPTSRPSALFTDCVRQVDLSELNAVFSVAFLSFANAIVSRCRRRNVRERGHARIATGRASSKGAI